MNFNLSIINFMRGTQTSPEILLLILALIYILITEKKKINRILCGYIPLAAVVLIWFNPLLHMVLRLVMDERENRYIWTVPYAMVIAYAAVSFIGTIKDSKKQALAGVIIAAVICGACSSFYTSELIKTDAVHFTENVYQVPQSTIEVADIIKNAGGSRKAIVTDSLAYNIRCYDGDLEIFNAHSNWYSLDDSVYDCINAADVDERHITNVASEHGFVYIVCEKGTSDRQAMEKGGYPLMTSTEEYDIYRWVNG